MRSLSARVGSAVCGSAGGVLGSGGACDVYVYGGASEDDNLDNTKQIPCKVRMSVCYLSNANHKLHAGPYTYTYRCVAWRRLSSRLSDRGTTDMLMMLSLRSQMMHPGSRPAARAQRTSRFQLTLTTFY